MKNFHTVDVFSLFKIDGVGAAQNDEELSLMPEVVKDEDASSDATHISSGAAIDKPKRYQCSVVAVYRFPGTPLNGTKTSGSTRSGVSRLPAARCLTR